MGEQDDNGASMGLRGLMDMQDWSRSGLGDRATWPRSLETVIDLMLSSKFAMCLGWGPDLTLLYNDAYVPFLGAKHPAALGQPLQTVWAEVWPDIEPLVESAMKGVPVGYEDMPLTMTRHGYPEETWWTFAYSPLRDDYGAVAGFLDIATETTDKVVHERQLAAREAELRALNTDLEEQIVARGRERATTWTVTSELLSVIDLQTSCFDRINPAWTATLGWTQQEMEGSPFSDFLLPDDALVSAAAFEEVREGNPVMRFDNRYRTKDGKVRWLSWVAVPFEGKLYSSARDITDERERADKLALAEDTLRQSQKMEAVGQLTGGVAHDFNNLLTVIRGSVDLLRRADLSEERRARYIDAIGETADRAAKLTGQLLAFARRQALKPETFDCGASITDVVSMVGTLTGSRIVIETVVPDDPCYVLADKGQFDTTIVNMSINARDAMDGEGKLTIVVGPVSGIPEIRLHPPVAGNYVAVTISDTGTGISPENIARIFEPFFTTKGLGKGTGLGLSQVIGFAKQSDGDIRVESGEEGGTTFTLYLPRVAMDGSRPTVEEEQPVAIPGDGVCVLVVEDNSSVGEFAVQALRELGYDTILALNADEALAELEKGCDRFHIVFSDVVMPGMSGLELAHEVRRRHPRMPVILTSGYSHVLAQNGRHGFELLHKPYSIEQLSRVFRKSITWQTHG
ncbi:hybrid sensor histidine kinase/response regulator [Sphingomonas nostoxanthinifaciens]|uniref:hybrid sensor histidine kinase/response regulator n=1 Tax=Sphingomonas nostoxanthinifaciens TaxID=2872652 RepID=UPI001CC1D1A7|nr:ATP-binding protein [Sphingomonas nostoxanthinifaciens]UAK23869.1 response regulator [Sphingomonas nostoxanthinifaciens]